MTADKGSYVTSRWQRRISRPGAPAVPIIIRYRRGARLYWVPRGYHRLAVATLTGRRFTFRELAPRLGYTASGLQHAIARVASWGGVKLVGVRGRLGYSRLVWAQDVEAGRPTPQPVSAVTVPALPAAHAERMAALFGKPSRYLRIDP